jgi:hypothetical protein
MPRTASVVVLTLTTMAFGVERSGAVAEPINRTVYVTITDGTGGPILDLAPADFVVKEGGKEREVVKIAPASARMRLALAVEERLVGDGATRVALFEFMKRIGDAAEISLITIGLRNTTVVDYTTSLQALAGAINSLTLNPRRESQVAEGVLDLANRFVESKPERPVIVVVSFSGGQAGVEARTVLDKLRQSGATMHAATLAGGDAAATPVGALGDHSGREEVLGDGPKQSGGRRIEVTTNTATAKALQQIAADLLAQYAITYVLPDGVKPDKRLTVNVKRRGVSLRAPTAIPDR